jgi:hypothetical protein
MRTFAPQALAVACEQCGISIDMIATPPPSVLSHRIVGQPDRWGRVTAVLSNAEVDGLIENAGLLAMEDRESGPAQITVRSHYAVSSGGVASYERR